VLYVLSAIGTGAIISYTIEFIGGTEIRCRAEFRKKHFLKTLHNPGIPTILTSKTESLSERELELEETREKIRNELSEKGFKIAQHGEDFWFNLQKDSSKIDVYIKFASSEGYEDENEPLEEKKLVVSEVELALKAECKFKQFEKELLNLTSACNDLEKILRSTVGVELGKKSLACELNSIYRLSGVLAALGMDSISGNFDDGISVDISDKKITVYDTGSNAASKIKEMFTMYG
jgi:hypothetical protein